MSYLVLARKWRPGSFAQMVGQKHVVQALTNALEEDRVHHAFLFTGTRGVGKTTVARILAKCLNCERGVSATPCGECGACAEIDEGRFVDLIEVDAASRARVDETRELLENVQYAPARGRYKVYLIDEVHMFSKHSFNALLKTLEEPPPHVKFLLATTDPQRLPITILSRCLQFNLRRLPLEQIAGQLGSIAEAESVPFEPGAMRLLARAADGSMRDGLSLLDQAISYGAGKVEEGEVRSLLGAIEHRHVLTLLEALAAQDASAMMSAIAELALEVPDFDEVLAELVSALGRLAVIQAVPDAPDDEGDLDEGLRELAGRLEPEVIQLYYQIGLIGRRDLSLAPTARGGFEMVMLRMLAFTPGEPDVTAGSTPDAAPTQRPARRESTPSSAAKQPAPPVEAAARPDAAAAGRVAIPAAGSGAGPAAEAGGVPGGGARPEPGGGHAPRPTAEAAPEPAAAGVADPGRDPLLDPNGWARLAEALPLGGLARELALNLVVQEVTEGKVRLALSPTRRQLLGEATQAKLKEALDTALGHPVRLEVELCDAGIESPAEMQARARDERQQEAVRAIETDPNVMEICERFAGAVQSRSIVPLGAPPPDGD